MPADEGRTRSDPGPALSSPFRPSRSRTHTIPSRPRYSPRELEKRSPLTRSTRPPPLRAGGRSACRSCSSSSRSRSSRARLVPSASSASRSSGSGARITETEAISRAGRLDGVADRGARSRRADRPSRRSRSGSRAAGRPRGPDRTGARTRRGSPSSARRSELRERASRRSPRSDCSRSLLRARDDALLADRDAEQHPDAEREEDGDQRDRVVAEGEQADAQRLEALTSEQDLELQPDQVQQALELRRAQDHDHHGDRARRAGRQDLVRCSAPACRGG